MEVLLFELFDESFKYNPKNKNNPASITTVWMTRKVKKEMTSFLCGIRFGVVSSCKLTSESIGVMVSGSCDGISTCDESPRC